MTWSIHKRDKSILAIVQGWDVRYAAYPRIAEQAIAARESQGHVFLYRGQKNIDHIDDVFTIGQKARPLYHFGDLSKLDRRPSTMATDRVRFGQLVGAFLGSKLGESTSSTFEKLMERFDARDEEDRVLLAQVLLESLQYRNGQLTGREWRDYLFLLSASTNAERAAMYALQNHPRKAFVLEYAPPHGRNLARSVKHFRTEYSELGLGDSLLDEDDEYMIRYAMLPHFLLGYTRLDRRGKAAPHSYLATYFPNPVYADGTATLDSPPDLDAAQEEVAQRTLRHIAWVFNLDDGARSGWKQIQTREGVKPLDPPVPAARLEQSTTRRHLPVLPRVRPTEG